MKLTFRTPQIKTNTTVIIDQKQNKYTIVRMYIHMLGKKHRKHRNSKNRAMFFYLRTCYRD